MQTIPLVIVTPVYEDREACSQLFVELANNFGASAFVVAVDDGSVREPLEPDSLRRAGLSGVVIRLRRNIGHQRAIAVGLGFVADELPNADRIVVMDSDGEDRPATIHALLDALQSPQFDIAVAERKSRVETLRFRAFYVLYKIIFGALTGRRISFGNFMALKPNAVKRLSAMHESWTHIAGSVLASKLRLAVVPLDRGARYAGRSKMNFVGLALHGFKALMVFAEDVLVRVGLACVVISIFAVLGALAAIVLKLVGFATPGWFSVALGVLFLVFLQTAALTLMTLMLSGVAKGGTVLADAYRDFVDSVIPVSAFDRE
ncbi:MAG: dolichol-phosphate mannosyltransferase [Gammaproteobacteria bacterium RIFCSPHIGHO2_12_FULL_63_22]|nr:MAG: dolichol-phosphate mannosyltransferase [Gammaproteobacteria bacterium RIFCSPHIGHO2_12_FULL_63_22]